LVNVRLSHLRCSEVCGNVRGRPPPGVDYRSDVPLWRARRTMNWRSRPLALKKLCRSQRRGQLAGFLAA